MSRRVGWPQALALSPLIAGLRACRYNPNSYRDRLPSGFWHVTLPIAKPSDTRRWTSGGFDMATCPECDAEIEVDEFDVDKGDQLSCPECGSNLEVVGLSPIELDLAADEDEDEDEDDEDVDEDELEDDEDAEDEETDEEDEPWDE
jgi:alpha-aminoadipate/glutamate carrier protein LysW